MNQLLRGFARALMLLPVALLSLSSTAQTVEETRWMSEEYPPYNYVDDDGVPKGVTFDILLKVFDKVGAKVDPKAIEFLPWARSYRAVQSDPATALFSMTYTPEREQLFDFVGPIIPSIIGVIAKKEKALKITDAAGLNTIKIGAIRDDIGDQLLRGAGVQDAAIDLSSSSEHMLKKLDSGRIDAIAYGTDIASWLLKKMQLDPNAYETVYVLKEGKMGYAFRKGTDPALLKKLQTALDELRADGSIEAISATYFK